MLLATRPARRLKIAPATALLLSVTAGQMIVLTILGWSSEYWFDDLLYLEQVKAGTISLHHMMLPMFGHMAPGHNFVYWALERFVPGRYHVALLLEVLVSGAVTLVLARVLRLLTQRRTLSAVVASLLAVSAVQVSAFAWLAAATDCIFSTLFTLLAAERFLVWRLNRRRSVLISCLVLWAVGLSFYEETAFLPVWLAALFGFVLPERWSWQQARRELLGLWQAWVGFALVGVGWLALYAAGPYGSIGSRPTFTQATGFLWVAWFKNFWTTAIGAWASWGLVESDLRLRLLGEAAFILLVVVTVARRRAAWRAWVFFVVSFVLHVGVIAYGRAAWGLTLGRQSFYVYESGWLLAISFVCAVGPASWAGSPVRQRLAALRVPRPRQARLVSAGLVALLLVVAGVRGATSAGKTFSTYQGRVVSKYVHNLQTDVAALRRSGQKFSVFDDKPPTDFAQLWYPSTNRLSVLLGTGYETGLTYNKPGLPSYIIATSGRLVPAHFAAQAQWTPKDAKAECWQGEKTLALTHPAKGDSLFLRLRTDQPQPVQLRIAVLAPGRTISFANDTNGLLDVPAGKSEALVPMFPTAATTVTIFAGGPPVCVRSVQIGTAAPVSSG